MVNPHFLVVGLGNITFARTRHSLGHFMIDALTNRLGVHLSSERSGWAARTSLDMGRQEPVTFTFFKPRALMNISGRPVVDMLRKTAIKPVNLIVIHDSLDHKPCVVSPKFGGSANGHNGVRSIIATLGNNPDFHRLRLGIGRGGLSGADITNYVLGPLSAQECDFWKMDGPGSEIVWKELGRIVEKTVAAAR